MSIKRTIISTVLALALVAVVAPVITSATTIDELMAQIATLQSQLTGLTGTPAVSTGTGACAGVTFSRNLVVGSTGSDVKCLQTILNNKGFQVSATGAGAAGYETTYFGAKTLVAVKAYQVSLGYTPANQVGPMTRVALNAAIGTTPVTTTTLPTGCTSTAGFSPVTGASCATGIVIVTPTGTVSAAVAASSPAAGAVVNNQARAGLLNVAFSGTGTVTSVTLQRSGISTSSTLSAVYLFDGATRITGAYSFNTNGQLVMNGLNIAVNGYKEISVVADVYSSATTDSSSIAVALVGFNGGSTNVQGNTMTIVTGSAATANFVLGTTASPVATTINAGSVNQTLWSKSVTISPRAVMLYGMTVKQIGSAPTNALSNVGLYVDGTLVGTATINSNSQFVFSTSNPVTLTTGSHLLEVRGDVVAGATRTLYLSLEQGSDLAIKDSQLGVYIATTTDSPAVTASNISGGVITLGGVVSGTSNITINQDTAFNSTSTLVGGATNVTMASFIFTAYGEDTKVTDVAFTPTITAGLSSTPNDLDTLSNVGLYINGAQVGSSQAVISGTALSFTGLGSQLIVPVGTPVTVSIKGDVIASTTDTGAGDSESYASATLVRFSVVSGSSQGVSSQATSTTGFTAAGQSLAVSSTNVVFAKSSSFAATTLSPSSTAKLGTWTLSTGTAEGITINNIAVTFPTGATNTAVSANQLTNVTVKVNGVAVGSPVGQPVITSPNNFSVSIPVAISSSATVEVWGTVGSSSTVYTVTPWVNITYRGTTSNLSTTYGAATGVESSTGVATIAVAGVIVVSSSSLAPQFIAGGSTGTLATFNVASSNGVGSTLKDMYFTYPANTIGAITVNGKTGTVIDATHAVVYNTGVVVPANTSGVNIPVSATLLCVGTGCNGVSDSTVTLQLYGITYNNGTTTATVGTTLATTGTLGVANVVSSTLKLVASVPTVTMANASTTGLTATAQQVGIFTIKAGTGGDIKVQNIPFTLTVQGVATSITEGSIYLYDVNGNALNGAPTNNGLSTSGTFTFPTTGRTINAGQSETYTVYATPNTLGATVGSSSVTFGLGAKASFTWTDVAGSVADIQGTNIYGYPTGVQTKSN